MCANGCLGPAKLPLSPDTRAYTVGSMEEFFFVGMIVGVALLVYSFAFAASLGLTALVGLCMVLVFGFLWGAKRVDG